MRTSMIAIAAVVGALGGCASVPPIEKQDYVRVSDIMYTTECELKETIDELSEIYTLNRQLIDVAYSLDVVEKGSGEGGGSLVVPITNGTFSLGITAAVARTNTRNTTFKVRYSSDQLRCPESDDPNGPQRIEGTLGLGSWLGNTAKALSSVKRWPRDMTYEMDFAIVKNASLKPAFGLELPSGHQYGASLSVAGSRSVTHGILVAATDIKPGDDRAVEAGKRLDTAVQQFRLKNN